MRVDVPELGGKRMVRHLGDGPGHLDACRAAAHHHEGEKPPLLVRVIGRFRTLEGQQDLAADPGRVLDLLQSRRRGGPFRMAEIGMRGPCREDEDVVGKGHVPGMDEPCLRIDARHVGHENGGVRLAPENAADRPGDVGRRQGSGRDLVEQRLEVMEVVPVDHRHVDGSSCQELGGCQAAEARPDNDNLRRSRCHGALASSLEKKAPHHRKSPTEAAGLFFMRLITKLTRHLPSGPPWSASAGA